MPAQTLMAVATVADVLDPLPAALADVIRYHMERGGFSAYALIKATGLPESRIYRVARGDYPVTVHELGLIAAALGTRASQLLEEAEARVADSTEDYRQET